MATESGPGGATSGVYGIRCVPTGKIYVGSTVDIPKRFHGHRKKLKEGVHPNAHLQSAWNKYGEEAFVFEIILRVGRKGLLDAEQEYICALNASDRTMGFNIRKVASSNLGLRYKSPKLSASMIGRYFSAETRAKIGAKHKGKTISPEARFKMRLAKLGKKFSEERCAEMSVAVRARGPEWKAKLSAAKIGNKCSLGRIHPPEVLAKISAASKAMWAARRAAKAGGAQ